MRSFAEDLGARLADYIMKTLPLYDMPDPGRLRIGEYFGSYSCAFNH